MAKKDGLAKGFTCTSCGREQLYSPYVYAHWDEKLRYTCSCGERHTIQHGRAVLERA
jgi:transcription elongation factor Elf1